MSTRLLQAISSKKVVLVNHESVSVSVEMIRFLNGDSKNRVSEVVSLPPEKKVNISKGYSVEEIRASSKLSRSVTTRKIEVVDTWSKT